MVIVNKSNSCNNRAAIWHQGKDFWVSMDGFVTQSPKRRHANGAAFINTLLSFFVCVILEMICRTQTRVQDTTGV